MTEPEAPPPGDLLEPSWVARQLGFKRRTIVDWCKRGILASYHPNKRWYVLRWSYLEHRDRMKAK